MRITFWCVNLSPTSASLNSARLCSGLDADSGSNNFMAKCRLLLGSTTSKTCEVCPVCSILRSRYPPMISLTSAIRHTSPVFFEMNVAFELRRGDIRFKTLPFENLDHAGRLRIAHRACLSVPLRHSNHFWITAQENMSLGGIEWFPELFFQLAAFDDILNINLTGKSGFARGQCQVFVVRISAHQAFLGIEITQIAGKAHATRRKNISRVAFAK